MWLLYEKEDLAGYEDWVISCSPDPAPLMRWAIEMNMKQYQHDCKRVEEFLNLHPGSRYARTIRHPNQPGDYEDGYFFVCEAPDWPLIQRPGEAWE
jgi:hypothetical protein